MSILGNFKINVGLDTTGLTANLNNIQSSVKRVGTSIAKIGTNSGLDNLNAKLKLNIKTYKDTDTALTDVNKQLIANAKQSATNNKALLDLSKLMKDVTKQERALIAESLKLDTALAKAFTNGDNALNKFMNNAKSKTSVLKGLAGTLGGLFAGYASFSFLSGITSSFNSLNSAISDSTELLNVNIGEVSSLGGALTRFGGDTNTAISTLENFNTLLNDAKGGKGGLTEIKKKFGISLDLTNSPEEAILELSRKVEGLGKETIKEISQTLKLDDSLTKAFIGGSDNLQQLINKQKQLKSITEDDIKMTDEYNKAMLDLKDSFNAISRVVGRLVVPIITKFTTIFTSFVEWSRKHSKVIIAFFIGLGIVLSPILISLAKMAALTAITFAPFIAVGAIIAGIALVIEDIYYYFMGWGSVTGDLVKKFPALAKPLEIIRPLIVGIFDTFNKIVEFFKNPSWGSFADIFITAGKAIWDYLTGLFKTLFGWLPNIAQEAGIKIWEYIKLPFVWLSSLIKEFSFKDLIDKIINLSKILLNAFLNPIQTFKTVANNVMDWFKEKLSWITGLINKVNPFSKKDDKQDIKEELQTLREKRVQLIDRDDGSLEFKKTLAHMNKQIKELETIVPSKSNMGDELSTLKERKARLLLQDDGSADFKEAMENMNRKIASLEGTIPPIKIPAIIVPEMPTQASITNNSNTSNTTSNSYNVNNNFNQQISSATPTQFANQTNQQIIDSINNVRVGTGAV